MVYLNGLWTLSYLAGHRDMAIARRYVHPQLENILGTLLPQLAMNKTGIAPNQLILKGEDGALGRIRTLGLLVRSQTLYPAELRARNRAGTSNVSTWAVGVNPAAALFSGPPLLNLGYCPHAQ